MAFRKWFFVLLFIVLGRFIPAQSIESASGLPEEADSTEAVKDLPLEAAEEVIEELEDTVTEQSERFGFVEKLGIALVIVVGQAFLIWLVWQFFKWLNKKASIIGGQKIKPLTIKKFRLLTVEQIINIIHFFLRIFKYIITIFQLFITIPIVFSLFPQTKNVASTLFSYILNPLKTLFLGGIRYIPNLITIIVILVVTKYILQGLKFFASQIEREKLVIPGFYSDWAQPTFNILRVILCAFTVAVIYPYLPGSGSPVFQGVSVFVGIIFSLGSTSAIGNLIAGLVITYMRPFKIGDRIQIKDITGFVVEKSPIVIRIKTHKNEYVTFPNMMILNSSIINYNTSSDEDEEGLVLHTDITFGYSTPWQTVHAVLIEAALKTDYVLKIPSPFVLQTAMNDFYANYQINFYTKEVDKVPAIYSNLYENIQSGFHAAGIDMTAAHYRINLPPQPYEPLPETPQGNPLPDEKESGKGGST
ncbi:MAG: mechanosensitive ion channel family protein [Spirochaetaceae bacterium]|nr:mechanosensitive ion channel family protein [Spirochaetaceae bacterium]